MDNKYLYWGLIGTFIILWLFVAFVSTLHAISFFQIGNTIMLSVLLAIAYEIGQSSILFSILLTKNKDNIMAWLMMILLTAVQVSANVYSTFKFIELSGTSDWIYWQKVMLFWLETDTPEMYKIIISFIQGALLPIVALGMTKLVADNIKLKNDADYEENSRDYDDDNSPDISGELSYDNSPDNEGLNKDSLYDSDPISLEKNQEKPIKEEQILPLDEIIENQGSTGVDTVIDFDEGEKSLDKIEEPIIEPSNKVRGWNLKTRYVDDKGKVFKRGKYIETIPVDPKKA